MRLLDTLIILYLSFQLGFSATLPNYDKLAITPTTWQEVDLKAYDYIKGKKYPADIKLLRPISWLKANHLDKVGNKANFSLPEFDIKDMYVIVVALKPTKLSTSKTNWSKVKYHPVIGTFKRYAPVVKTYTFKNLTTGKTSKVTSTPGHKYYVKDRTVNNIIGKNTHYISISRVRSDDILISQAGDKIKLICSANKITHCGKLYNTDHKPIHVYNLEIYNKHRYFVGNNSILVHNGGCTGSAQLDTRAIDEIDERISPLADMVDVVDIPDYDDSGLLRSYQYTSKVGFVRSRRLAIAKELGLDAPDITNREYIYRLGRSLFRNSCGQCNEMAAYAATELEDIAKSYNYNVYTIQLPEVDHTMTLLSKNVYNPLSRINWESEFIKNSIVVDLWESALVKIRGGSSELATKSLVSWAKLNGYTSTNPRAYIQTQIW